MDFVGELVAGIRGASWEAHDGIMRRRFGCVEAAVLLPHPEGGEGCGWYVADSEPNAEVGEHESATPGDAFADLESNLQAEVERVVRIRLGLVKAGA